MLQKYTFLVGIVVGLSLLAYVGCSSDGDGEGGGEGTALSLDGETTMPATGGASIAIDQGAAFASVISSMLSELAADAPSPALAPKQIPLGICAGGGSADLEGLFESGETASLTLTDCIGSPFGGTVNGKMLLNDMALSGLDPVAFTATAGLAGLEEDSEFSVSPDTVLTGAFKVDASITFNDDGVVAQVDLVLGRNDTEATKDDWIDVDDLSGESLRLTCFEISTSIEGIDTATPAVTSFKPRGVLVLAGKVYTLNSLSVEPPDIGFDPSGSTAVPISGTMELFSGDRAGCSLGAGDDSSVEAVLGREGDTTLVNVVATGADGTVYVCTEQWENLLATLQDLAAFERCPPAVAIDVLTCAEDALLDFNAYLDPLIEVFKGVEEGRQPTGILIDWGGGENAGTFEVDLDLDGDGSLERRLLGTVGPTRDLDEEGEPPICVDGMQQGEVCIVRWTVVMNASSEEVSYGAISAVALGFSVPLQTTSTRLVITDFDLMEPERTNIQIDQSSFCSMTVDRFQMLWHLRIDDMYNLDMGFEVSVQGAATDSGRGDVIWGSGTGSEATITFTVDGKRFDCGFDVDTFVVSCP